MSKIELNAELRQDVGKGASRRLRRLEDKVPGIIYGSDEPPVTLTLSSNELSKVMQQEAFYSQILNVKIEGKAEQAVVRDLQRNPANNKVIHLDFLRVSANRALQVHVPIHFVDEEKCVGVRVSRGIIARNLIEIEISCLPANLPEYIEVYMAELDVGQSVHLSDLALPNGVTIPALALGEDHDTSVVSVQAPRGGGEDDEDSEDTEASGEGDDAGGEEESDAE